MDAPNIADFRTGADVDETFAEAVVHKPCHKVLGFRLRPFSFWHAANLDFIESPFAGHKKPIVFQTLYVAARTCQLQYPNTFRRRDFELLIEWWKAWKYRQVRIQRACSHRPVAGRWKRNGPQGRGYRAKATGRSRSYPFLTEVSKFSAYMRDYIARPDYISSENSESVKTPWYLYEVALHKRLNPEKTWAKCWDMPVGEASWYNAATLEASGIKIEILTPAMRKTFDEIDRLTSA